MKKLNKDAKKVLAEKILDLANLVFIGLVISQFVPEVKINILSVGIGIFVLILGYIIAIILLK